MATSAAAVAAFGLLAVVYWQWFDKSACAAQHVQRTCVAHLLRDNEGVVTAYGLLVALAGVFVTLLFRATDEERIRDRYRQTMHNAVYEAYHNLRHVAGACKGPATFDRSVQLGLDEARALLTDPLTRILLEDALDEGPPRHGIWGHIDHMARNDDILRRLEWNSQLNVATEYVEYFVLHALSFIVDASRRYRKLLALPGHFQFDASQSAKDRKRAECDLACFQCALTVLAARHDFRYLARFSAKRATSRLASFECVNRTEFKYIFCWIKEEDLELDAAWGDTEGCRPTYVPIGRLFASLTDPP